MLLYNNIRSIRPHPYKLIGRYELETIDKLPDAGSCVMLAQIVHVKKGQKAPFTVKGDSKKRIGKAYDRLIYLRDCLTGLAFVVVSENTNQTYVHFYKGAHIGSYVFLYLPEGSVHELRDVPVVQYADVFLPAAEGDVVYNFETQVMDTNSSFGTFHFGAKPDEITVSGFGIVQKCSGQICDGLENVCSCQTGSGTAKNVIVFKITLPIPGGTTMSTHHTSVSFTKRFIKERVMVDLNKFDIQAVEDWVKRAFTECTRILLSGWVGYSTDKDDEVETIRNVHLSNIDFVGYEFEPRENFAIPEADSNEDRATTMAKLRAGLANKLVEEQAGIPPVGGVQVPPVLPPLGGQLGGVQVPPVLPPQGGQLGGQQLGGGQVPFPNGGGGQVGSQQTGGSGGQVGGQVPIPNGGNTSNGRPKNAKQDKNK